MKLEILEKGYFYHIYNKGINGANIFSNNENKNYFLKQLNKYLNDKVSIYAYCLMDNHFHLIIKVNSDPDSLTQSFSNFFNSYAKAYNKQISRTGSLFEKHFKRIRLEDELYLKNLILYVHLNPKHHLNIDYNTFLFSSYQSMLSDKETKLERKDVLNLFGGIDNFIFCHNSKKDLLTERYTFE
jgi:REP element-mobilizing transposase RayT